MRKGTAECHHHSAVLTNGSVVPPGWTVHQDENQTQNGLKMDSEYPPHWNVDNVSQDPETFHRNVRCTKESDLAIYVQWSTFGGGWVPKKAIHDDSEVFGQGMVGKLVVFFWWSEEYCEWWK